MKQKLILFHVYFIVQLWFWTTLSLELLQIHTLTRHGERSPCSSYPTDPYTHLWTQGLGQLTSRGIDQLKEVGTFLRSYYHEFLPETFHKKVFHIRSSDSDRTIMSALAAMSTLFENQIIPVHTVPKSYDFLLKMKSKCPHYKELLAKEYKSEKNQKIIDQYSSFLKVLEEHTGMTNIDIHQGRKICGSIIVWDQLKLTFPNWLSTEYVEKCKSLSDLKFTISYSNVSLTRFRGGPLANNMVENMMKRVESFVTNKTGLKMVGYFSHDSTIAAFLSHLGSFNGVKPPLASTVIIELYHDSQSIQINDEPLSQYFVRLLFRNDTSIAPHILDISICQNKDGSVGQKNGYCRLDVLRNSLQPFIINDLAKECGLTSNIDMWITSHHNQKKNIEHVNNEKRSVDSLMNLTRQNFNDNLKDVKREKKYKNFDTKNKKTEKMSKDKKLKSRKRSAKEEL